MKNLRVLTLFIVNILTYLGVATIHAQESKFNVTQDKSFERLLTEKNQVNNSFSIYKNYSLQLFYGPRDEAQSIYHDFKKAYPKTDATIIFASPNYKVVVGNFKNKINAENFLKQINKKYPNALLVRLKK